MPRPTIANLLAVVALTATFAGAGAVPAHAATFGYVSQFGCPDEDPSTAEGDFNAPRSIVFANGALFVGDSAGASMRVQKMTTAGALLGSFAIAAPGSRLGQSVSANTLLATNPLDGEVLVEMLSGTTATEQHRWVISGFTPGSADKPLALAEWPDGTIQVLTSDLARVLRQARDGGGAVTARPGTAPGSPATGANIDIPTGMSISPGTTSYFVSDASSDVANRGRVLLFDRAPAGSDSFVRDWKTENVPVGIVALAGGAVWVANQNGVLEKFDSMGVRLLRVDPLDVPGGLTPMSIAVDPSDPSGNIFVPDDSLHDITRVLVFGTGGARPASGGGAGSPALLRCGGAPAPGGSSALTAAIAPAAAVWGTTFAVTGTLRCGGELLGGAAIRLQSRAIGAASFTNGPAGTTASGGTFRWNVIPSAITDYRVLFVRTGTCGPATSPVVRAGVRLGVPMNVGPSVPAGHDIRISGSIRPAHPGLRVALQRLNGRTGQWTTLRYAKADARSNYAFVERRTTKGSALYRVLTDSHLDHLWGASRNVKLVWT